MSLFKTKTKHDLKDFCTQYYDTYILETKPTIPAVKDFSENYNKLISEKIIEADNSFKSVDFNSFSKELLKIRFELFSLAWFHEFGDKSAIQQTIFTKEYLINNHKEEIWNDIEPYNQTIAQSATHGCDSSTAPGRMRIYSVTKMRLDLSKKYFNEGIDPKCVARAINKFGTQSNWQSLRIALGYLVITLCKNLNYTFNEKTSEILIAMLKGLYDGSKQNLEKIKIGK
jgi:hypothetical protein